MVGEADFIATLRSLATDPSARKLLDDAAVLEFAGASLVLTHDMIVEGVHYFASDPPEEVAWKLVAVNLSDLAAKGARPLGVLLGYALGEPDWDQRFVRGLGTALTAFGLPLLGGDTVSVPERAARSLGLTAIGWTDGLAPARSGASPGHHLWVSGTIGDAGGGLELLQEGGSGPEGLIDRYRNPRPRLEAGQKLAPLVAAMMDVSDGLLIDSARMAEASGCAAVIELDTVPLSDDLRSLGASVLEAATAGDDYELLFAAPPERAVRIAALAEEIGLAMSRIGRFEPGAGLSLTEHGAPVPLPARLGFEHGVSGRPLGG